MDTEEKHHVIKFFTHQAFLYPYHSSPVCNVWVLVCVCLYTSYSMCGRSFYLNAIPLLIVIDLNFKNESPKVKFSSVFIFILTGEVDFARAKSVDFWS